MYDHQIKKAASSPGKQPEYDAPLCAAALRGIFRRCADFEERTVRVGGEGQLCLSVFWLDGLISSEEAAESVLRPLTDPRRSGAVDEEGCCASCFPRRRRAKGGAQRHRFSQRRKRNEEVFHLPYYIKYLSDAYGHFSRRSCTESSGCSSCRPWASTPRTARCASALCAGISAAFALLAAPDGKTLTLLSGTIIPAASLFFALVFFPSLLGLGRLRGRI